MKKRFLILALAILLVLQSFLAISCNTERQSGTEATEKATESETEKATEKATEKSTEKATEPEKSEEPKEPEEPEEIDEDELLLEDLLEMKIDMRADEEGNFKVLILSDIQGSNSHIDIPESVRANIRNIVNREQPDLVIFNGDNCHEIKGEENLREYLTNMTLYLEQNKIPWAHVYGNHDDVGGISKERQSEIYAEFKYCISEVGSVSGVGNYVIPIYSHDGSRILYNVWCLDSHGYTKLDDKINVTLQNGVYFKGTYDYIKPDQIEWYLKSSKLLEEYNGAPIPAIMAFHIPLQETGEAWMVKDSAKLEWTGEKHENGGFSAINSGMFAAVLARGDVKAIVNGHDHVNDFMVKYHGVMLCYSSTVSTMSYYQENLLGARVFSFSQDENAPITTYMSYLNK
jgi:hypothetical protein